MRPQNYALYLPNILSSKGGALFCRYFCVPLDGIKKPKSGNGKEIQGEQCSPDIRWEGGRCIAVCCYSFVMIQLHEYRH